jgi:CDP-glucose 4,6-dehydratase
MFNNVYKNKNVFITGHTGFKGTWLTLWLKQLGANVTGYSSHLPSSPCLFEAISIENDIKHIIGDVRDQETLRAAITETNPDIVFHLAANAIVRDCYDNPVEAFETNVLGTVNLLNIVKDSPGIKAAVFITSDKCYENIEWEYGYRENDQLGGKDPYSATKACAEIAASTFMRSYFSAPKQTKIATARAGNVIGGGDWANHRLIPDCFRSWSENESVEIRSPNATRPWQHVLEPLSGYLTLGQNLLTNHTTHLESFNFGPQTNFDANVLTLLKEMKKYWSNVNWDVDESKVGSKQEAGLLKLCVDKALFQLDWQANLDFYKTVEMTTKWYLEYYQGNKENIREFTKKQINEYENIATEKNLIWTRKNGN